MSSTSGPDTGTAVTVLVVPPGGELVLANVGQWRAAAEHKDGSGGAWRVEVGAGARLVVGAMPARKPITIVGEDARTSTVVFRGQNAIPAQGVCVKECAISHERVGGADGVGAVRLLGRKGAVLEVRGCTGTVRMGGGTAAHDRGRIEVHGGALEEVSVDGAVSAALHDVRVARESSLTVRDEVTLDGCTLEEHLEVRAAARVTITRTTARAGVELGRVAECTLRASAFVSSGSESAALTIGSNEAGPTVVAVRAAGLGEVTTVTGTVRGESVAIRCVGSRAPTWDVDEVGTVGSALVAGPGSTGACGIEVDSTCTDEVLDLGRVHVHTDATGAAADHDVPVLVRSIRVKTLVAATPCIAVRPRAEPPIVRWDRKNGSQAEHAVALLTTAVPTSLTADAVLQHSLGARVRAEDVGVAVSADGDAVRTQLTKRENLVVGSFVVRAAVAAVVDGVALTLSWVALRVQDEEPIPIEVTPPPTARNQGIRMVTDYAAWENAAEYAATRDVMVGAVEDPTTDKVLMMDAYEVRGSADLTLTIAPRIPTAFGLAARLRPVATSNGVRVAWESTTLPARATVTLEDGPMRPGHQMHVAVDIVAADSGAQVATVHEEGILDRGFHKRPSHRTVKTLDVNRGDGTTVRHTWSTDGPLTSTKMTDGRGVWVVFQECTRVSQWSPAVGAGAEAALVPTDPNEVLVLNATALQHPPVEWTLHPSDATRDTVTLAWTMRIAMRAPTRPEPNPGVLGEDGRELPPARDGTQEIAIVPHADVASLRVEGENVCMKRVVLDATEEGDVVLWTDAAQGVAAAATALLSRTRTLAEVLGSGSYSWDERPGTKQTRVRVRGPAREVWVVRVPEAGFIGARPVTVLVHATRRRAAGWTMGETVDAAVRLVPLYSAETDGAARATQAAVVAWRGAITPGAVLWWDGVGERGSTHEHPTALTKGGPALRLAIAPLARPPRGAPQTAKLRVRAEGFLPPLLGLTDTVQCPADPTSRATIALSAVTDRHVHDDQRVVLEVTEVAGMDVPSPSTVALRFEEVTKATAGRCIRPILETVLATGPTVQGATYGPDADMAVRFTRDGVVPPRALACRRPSTRCGRTYVSFTWGSVPVREGGPVAVSVRWFATDERGCELPGDPGAHAAPVRFVSASTGADVTHEDAPCLPATWDDGGRSVGVWADVSHVRRTARRVRFFVTLDGLQGTDYLPQGSGPVTVPVCELDVGPDAQGRTVPGLDEQDADSLGVLYVNGWRITTNDRNELEFAYRVFDDEPWRVAHAIKPPRD